MAEKDRPERDRNNGEIHFKPVTEGLGFHPFSNGLPYTSTVKPAQRPAAYGLGTGATAAGAPTFARSIPRVASSNTPSPVAQTVPVSASLPVQASAPQLRTFAPETFGFEYAMKRASAYIVDTGVNIGLGFAALTVGLWKQGLNPELLTSGGIFLLTILFLIFFDWALLTAQEIAFGTSLGKRLFGLRIEGLPSQVLLRAALFLPSLMLGGLGVLWVLLDRDRRGWHDIASGLQPREVARL